MALKTTIWRIFNDIETCDKMRSEIYTHTPAHT